MNTTKILAKKYNEKSYNAVALVGDFTIHFAIKNGKVYNVSDPKTFNFNVSNSIEFEFEIPTENIEFETLKSLYDHKKYIELVINKEMELKMIKDYEDRKKNIIGLWKFRHNETGAYVVRTSNRCNSFPDSTSKKIELFFDETEAIEYYENIKETSPDVMFGNSGWFFCTELYRLIDYDYRLKITDLDELFDSIFQHGDLIKSSEYSDPIPEDHIIVDLYQKQYGGSYRYNGCSKLGNSRKNYADLAPFKDNSPNSWQDTMTIYEAIESYGIEVIKDLDLSKDEAIEAGLDDSIIEEYFTEEEIETEE